MKKNINDNQYVFTTKSVVNGSSVVKYVIHDEDGDWQFFGCEDELVETNAMILSLKEMIELDSSLEELITMPIGTQAYRKNPNDAWVLSSIDNV